jgi:hypothetical protein
MFAASAWADGAKPLSKADEAEVIAILAAHRPDEPSLQTVEKALASNRPHACKLIEDGVVNDSQFFDRLVAVLKRLASEGKTTVNLDKGLPLFSEELQARMDYQATVCGADNADEQLARRLHVLTVTYVQDFRIADAAKGRGDVDEECKALDGAVHAGSGMYSILSKLRERIPNDDPDTKAMDARLADIAADGEATKKKLSDCPSEAR